MAGIRALQRRVKKMEKADRPQPSPVDVLCGSLDAFVDEGYAGVNAGALDKQFLDVLDSLRQWQNSGVWSRYVH